MTDQYLMPTYARQPVAFSRGEGCWLYDDAGNAWLDAVAGVAVCNLGHAHPAVVDALARQAAALMHTSNLYRIPAQEALAERLCRVAGMERAFFGNSGAEANEAAIKLARLYGHRKGVDNPSIVVMEGAFHGRTLATLTATGNRKVQAGFEPLVSGFVRAPWNDVDAVQRIVEHNRDVVAILVEPIQGEGGVRLPADDYLARLRALCDQHGLLLMLDEIQTGNGRTGSYFACREYGVEPDVLTTAKGLGNGFPIGACLARGVAAELFGPGSHGSTYGGNPLGCATALAVVQALEAGVVAAVHERGEALRNALRAALGELEMVREIRGRGLINGIEFDRPCGELVDLCRERGLLINVTAGNVVRLIPPLVISPQEIDTLVERLAGAVRAFVAAQEAA